MIFQMTFQWLFNDFSNDLSMSFQCPFKCLFKWLIQWIFKWLFKWLLCFRSWFLILDSWFLILYSLFLVLNSWFLKHSIPLKTLSARAWLWSSSISFTFEICISGGSKVRIDYHFVFAVNRLVWFVNKLYYFYCDIKIDTSVY